MALDASDLEKLGQFIESKITGLRQELTGQIADATAPAPVDRASQVGVPDVSPEAGPTFYVHLADGQVIESQDSASTHMPGPDGTPVQVIGRYQKGQ